MYTPLPLDKTQGMEEGPRLWTQEMFAYHKLPDTNGEFPTAWLLAKSKTKGLLQQGSAICLYLMIIVLDSITESDTKTQQRK